MPATWRSVIACTGLALGVWAAPLRAEIAANGALLESREPVSSPSLCSIEDGLSRLSESTLDWATREPSLPPGVSPFETVLVPIPGDRPVLVVHAPASNRRPIVYMHGMCGNMRAVHTWKLAAAQYGTFIGLLGDQACGGGRFKWTQSVEPIDARIQVALQVVRDVRGGLLDLDELVLFGYSQGADRASLLARRYPERYRRLVLGGPSHQPKLANLGDALAVAVFGGERETTYHMQRGAQVLAAAGKPARFFLLPSAKHGQFGPQGDRVVSEVLSWVLSPYSSADAARELSLR